LTFKRSRYGGEVGKKGCSGSVLAAIKGVIPRLVPFPELFRDKETEGKSSGSALPL